MTYPRHLAGDLQEYNDSKQVVRFQKVGALNRTYSPWARLIVEVLLVG